MNSLGYSDSEMEEASLLSKSSKSGNYFDFFKYRVMFPFIDVRGNIVGFSGRVIGGEDNRKYLNTCLLYTSPSPRDRQKSRMPSSA